MFRPLGLNINRYLSVRGSSIASVSWPAAANVFDPLGCHGHGALVNFNHVLKLLFCDNFFAVPKTWHPLPPAKRLHN